MVFWIGMSNFNIFLSPSTTQQNCTVHYSFLYHNENCQCSLIELPEMFFTWFTIVKQYSHAHMYIKTVIDCYPYWLWIEALIEQLYWNGGQNPHSCFILNQTSFSTSSAHFSETSQNFPNFSHKNAYGCYYPSIVASQGKHSPGKRSGISVL